MKRVAFGKTMTGPGRRHNEDCFYINHELGLYILSDGMGGRARGEVASAMAVETAKIYVEDFAEEVRGIGSGKSSPQRVASILRRAVRAANRYVYKAASSRHEHRGMGATLIVLIVSGGYAIMAHVGDSRFYWCRGEYYKQVSKDHTLFASLARKGLLRKKLSRDSPLSYQLTRAVGVERDVTVDSEILKIKTGDVFLLCSDGVSDVFKRSRDLSRWQSMFARKLDSFPESLISWAIEQGAHDDMTAIVVRAEPDTVEIPHRASEGNWIDSQDLAPVPETIPSATAPTVSPDAAMMPTLEVTPSSISSVEFQTK